MISWNRKLIICYIIILVSVICTVKGISAFASTHKHPKRQSDTILMNSQPLEDNVQRIVLIGGGHAHVQVIKALNKHSRPSNIHVTLIDLQSNVTYSGMVPGCVAKLYNLNQTKIALDLLAEWSDIEFICGKVVGMSFDNDGKKIVLVEVEEEYGGTTKKKESIQFDVVSVDIGSTTRLHTSLPGAKQYTISTRPISDLVLRIQQEEGEMIKKQPNEDQVVVVGGGAAGVELSLAIRARWNDLLDSKTSITLIDSSDVLLSSETDACRSALQSIVKKYNINVRNNLMVDEVTSTHIHVKSTNSDNDGKRTHEKIPYSHCIWATGAEAHTLSFDLNKQIGLDISNRGWIRVNKHMQSLSHPSIFAAGDCCEIIDDKKSPPKAGVYAVRSGPILIENLIRYLDTKSNTKRSELVTYNPQDDFLKLIMCGDGTVLGFRFGIPIYGKWVWKLKDHIDTMFMDLFDVNKLPKYNEEEGTELDLAQYDAYETAKEQMKVEDAAKLLLRRDDDVDYQTAWSVIREMNTDEDYRKEVLRIMNDSPDIWWQIRHSNYS